MGEVTETTINTAFLLNQNDPFGVVLVLGEGSEHNNSNVGKRPKQKCEKELMKIERYYHNAGCIYAIYPQEYPGDTCDRHGH